MPHQNTVFHDLLKLVPWDDFEAIVRRHGGDDMERGFKTKTQLIALLYGQLCGASSLREIVCQLESHEARLYHLGGGSVKRSTLAEANAQRPSAIFTDLLKLLMKRVHRGLRQQLGELVYLIDSTGFRLNSLSAHWARFSTKVEGGKVHIIYDPDADCPLYALVTPARVNDITVAQSMPIEPGATYVFDLGYYDYAWWAKLHAAQCRFVTRLKSNTHLSVESEYLVPDGSDILSDRIGYLPQRQARNRKNPCAAPLREIRVRIETGKILRILTNDLNADSQEIADLYKRRWAIELFFRWIKQALKIRNFVGASENAVRIQIAVALIAFLLLRLAQTTLKSTLRPLHFARVIRANLMHKRRLDQLHPSAIPPPSTPRQAAFTWT